VKPDGPKRPIEGRAESLTYKTRETWRVSGNRLVITVDTWDVRFDGEFEGISGLIADAAETALMTDAVEKGWHCRGPLLPYHVSDAGLARSSGSSLADARRWATRLGGSALADDCLTSPGAAP